MPTSIAQQPWRTTTSTVTRRYLNNPEGIDDVLAFDEGGQVFFPLTDALGSIVAIMDSAGAVVRRNSYEVYGARTSTGSGPDWAFGFTGREQDASGWRYHRDRYASAVTGTWGQADRLGSFAMPKALQLVMGTTGNDALNRYLYSAATPIMRVDPSGKVAVLPILLVVAAFGLGAYLGYKLKFAMALADAVSEDSRRVGPLALSGGLPSCQASVLSGLAGFSDLAINESSSLPVFAVAGRGGDSIWIHSSFVRRAEQGDPRQFFQLVIGEWQHTRFGGSQDDPSAMQTTIGNPREAPIQKEFEDLVNAAGVGPPLFVHGLGL